MSQGAPTLSLRVSLVFFLTRLIMVFNFVVALRGGAIEGMSPVTIQTKVELREYGIVVFEIEATSKSGRLQHKCRVVFWRWVIRFEIYCSDFFDCQFLYHFVDTRLESYR